jgi:hypothetical protein
MMILDSVDMEEARRIHNDSFPFPPLDSKLYFTQKSAVDNGQLIAVGLAKLTCEAIVIADGKQPLVTRARAIKELLNVQLSDAKRFGLADCHAFVKPQKMIAFLEHYGFTNLKGETPLVIQL